MMDYDKDLVRKNIQEAIKHEQWSVNVTWLLRASGINWLSNCVLGAIEGNSNDTLINSYVEFVTNIYNDTVGDYKIKYPSTIVVINTITAYLNNPSLNDIAVKVFQYVFGTFDTDEKIIVVGDTQKNALAEYCTAVANDDIELVYIKNGVNVETIQGLWNLMFDEPSFESITEPTIFMRLAILLYMIQHNHAAVGVFYVDPKYINDNKSTLTGSLRALPVAVCTNSSQNKIMYYDPTDLLLHNETATGRISVSLPDGNIPAASERLVLEKAGYGATIVKWYKNGTSYDSTTHCSFNASNSSGGVANVLQQALPGYFLSSADFASAQTIPDNYFRIARNTPTASALTNTRNGLSTLNTSVELSASSDMIQPPVYDTNSPTATQWRFQKYVSQGVASVDETISCGPLAGYIEGYSNNAHINLNDVVADDKLVLKVPDDDTINKVLSGEKNLTAVLDENGNYAVNPDGTIVTTPGSVIQPGTNHSAVVDPNTTQNFYGESIAQGFISTYVCSSSDLRALAQILYSPTVLEQLVKIFTDPIKLIRSLSYIPFVFPVGDAVSLKLGLYDTKISVNPITQQYHTFSYGVFDQTPDPSSFMNYEPYSSYKLYVPFSGWFGINSTDFVGKEVKIDCVVNVLTGDILTTYWANNNKIYTFTGSCMQEIPLTDRSSSSPVAAVAGLGAAVAATALTGGAAAAVMVGASGSAALMGHGLSPNVQTVGGLNGNLGYMGERFPYIVCETQLRQGDEKYYYTCGVTKHLNGLHGYNEIRNLIINNNNISQKEQEEINSLMDSGVFL